MGFGVWGLGLGGGLEYPKPPPPPTPMFVRMTLSKGRKTGTERLDGGATAFTVAQAVTIS